MKNPIFILITFLFFTTKTTAQIAINDSNTPPNSKAMLDVNSASKGILIPRLTAFQKAAISPVPIGLMVYDATLNQFSYFNGSVWINVSGASGSPWTYLGNDIYNANSGNVTIGTLTPNSFSKFEVLNPIASGNGIQGNSTGQYGIGVYGRQTNSGFGVFGEATGGGGIGGYFSGYGATGKALKAEISQGGTAAFFTATGTGGKGLIVDEGSVGIGTTTPNASAKLEVNSTDKGFLLPRMTNAQRLAIATPSSGLMVFVYDTQSLWIFRDGSWMEYTENLWQRTGLFQDVIKNTNTGGFFSANPVAVEGSSNPPATAPVSGEGTRMMWIPSRSAFRVGTISSSSNSFWNAANIGLYSFASGLDTRASGELSTAMGRGVNASAYNSTAFGYYTAASGVATTAMGSFTIAFGGNSTAIGEMTIANGRSSLSTGAFTQSSGDYSIAMGNSTTSSGYASSAMGISSKATGYVSTSLGYNCKAEGDYSKVWGTGAIATHEGSLILTDASLKNDAINTYQYPSEAINQFKAVFTGGYKFYSSSSVGVQVVAGGNAWTTISDSTKKHNFLAVNGEDFLQKIAKLKLTSWNYKTQDAKTFRHYGPMAQDFYQAFGKDALGTIGCDTLINQADFDGVNLIAIQALEKRTQELSKQNEDLKNKLKQYEARFEAIEASLNKNTVIISTGK
jgi:hypothetical protein